MGFYHGNYPEYEDLLMLLQLEVYNTYLVVLVASSNAANESSSLSLSTGDLHLLLFFCLLLPPPSYKNEKGFITSFCTE